MELTVSHEQARVPVTVIQVKGDIDITSYEQLQAEAQDAVGAGTRYVLLDLSGVSYVSSAGIRALHNVFTLLRQQAPEGSAESITQGLRDGTYKSPHLKLLHASERVFKALSTAGVDMYLEIHRDRETALASF